MPVPRCRHDSSPAVAIVTVPEGCVAFPDDKQQFLCWQHYGSVYDGTDGDYDTVMILPEIAKFFGVMM